MSDESADSTERPRRDFTKPDDRDYRLEKPGKALDFLDGMAHVVPHSSELH